MMLATLPGCAPRHRALFVILDQALIVHAVSRTVETAFGVQEPAVTDQPLEKLR